MICVKTGIDNENVKNKIKNNRFYESVYPEIDEVVMVEVKSVADLETKVSLLEYNNIMGMIPSAELSRRRVKSVQKMMKIGKQMQATVIEIDLEKALIVLSASRLSLEQLFSCDDRFRKSKVVHSIMSCISESFHRDLELLYQTIAWPLSKIYGHAHDAFKSMLQDRNEVLGKLKNKPEEVVCDELFRIVEQKIVPMTFKVRADVEMTCFEYDGIVAIKEAIRAAQAAGSELLKKVEMRLIAAPKYALITLNYSTKNGIDALNHALQASKKVIESFKGKMLIKDGPRIACGQDDMTTPRPPDLTESSCDENEDSNSCE
jgi:translation initiation factor 2 subunit 1